MTASRVIHKFTLDPRHGEQTVNLPVGFEPLSVGFQGLTLCLWAAVAEYALLEPQTILVALTGHAPPVDPRWRCIGRAEAPGPFVTHVFILLDVPQKETRP